MIKKKSFIFIGFVLLLVLIGCQEVENIKSTLIVNNLPQGEYSVYVFPQDLSNEIVKTNMQKITGFVALSSRVTNSPITLVWYETISSGNRLVAIRKWNIFPEPDLYKINNVHFLNNGNATVDWNDMILF